MKRFFFSDHMPTCLDSSISTVFHSNRPYRKILINCKLEMNMDIKLNCIDGTSFKQKMKNKIVVETVESSVPASNQFKILMVNTYLSYRR